MSSNLTVLEKLGIYVTGTYRLPKTSMLHVPPPLDWQDAEKLAAHLQGSGHAQPQELPKTNGFSEAQLFDTYAAYVRGHGSRAAQDALAAGEQVIVGLRITTNTRANHGLGIYDDRMALIWQDVPKAQSPVTALSAKPAFIPASFQAPATAVKHGLDFRANTEPSAQYEDPGKQFSCKRKPGKVVTPQVASKITDLDGKEIQLRKREGRDTNGDGRYDLGRLVEGTYAFHIDPKRPIYLRHEVLRPVGTETVQRDTNHDGWFTKDDIWHTKDGDTIIETRGGDEIAILIHYGGEKNTWSAGCQTLPPAEHKRFFHALKRPQPHYYYVLVTVR